MSNTDLQYGLDLENLLHEKVKECFGNDIVQTSGCHPYDYYNHDTFIELKSRRCKHDTYPTTMIGLNKINFARDLPDKSFVFIFRFTDGLYQHIFDPKKNYEVKMGGRQDRGRAEYKQYVYIPIKDLKSLSS